MSENPTHADATQVPVTRPGAPHRGRRGVLLQIGPAQASKKARRSTAPATKQQALAAYGKLPLSFTANAGQADARVRYAAHGAGFSVFLTRREAMLSLQRSGKQRRGRGVALALRFLGSNRNVAIRGERPGPARVNYLLGNDPTKWHTGLRTYERVVYRNLWPGVDMVFAGQNGELKYEFLVRPGARVARHQARLPRREAALARPARKPAHRHLARRPHRHATA